MANLNLTLGFLDFCLWILASFSHCFIYLFSYLFNEYLSVPALAVYFDMSTDGVGASSTPVGIPSLRCGAAGNSIQRRQLLATDPFPRQPSSAAVRSGSRGALTYIQRGPGPWSLIGLSLYKWGPQMSKFDWSKNFCSDWLVKKLMGYSPTALTEPGKRQPIGWNTARKCFPGLAHVAGALCRQALQRRPPEADSGERLL